MKKLLIFLIVLLHSALACIAKVYDGISYAGQEKAIYENGILMRRVLDCAYAYGCDNSQTRATLRNKVYINHVLLPVRSISADAFNNKRNLKVLDARPAQFLASMGRRICYNCINMDSVYLPDATDENYYLTEIPTDAFLDCRSLKYVNIPVKVILIGQSAFRRCRSLPSIGIPYTVEG